MKVFKVVFHIAVSLLSDMDGEIIADYRNPKKNGIGPSWLWNNPENRVYFRPFSV